MDEFQNDLENNEQNVPCEQKDINSQPFTAFEQEQTASLPESEQNPSALETSPIYAHEQVPEQPQTAKQSYNNTEYTPSGNLVYENAFESSPPEAFYRETIKQKSPKQKKHRSFKQTVAIVCILSLIGGCSVGFSIGAGSLIAKDYIIPMLKGEQTSQTKDDVKFGFDETGVMKEQASANGTPAEPETASVFSGNTASSIPSYADIVNSVEPSVVSITSHVEQDNFGLRGFGFEMPEATAGLGSGILFFEGDSKYYIVTNYHVIQQALDVTVSINGSEPISAKPVGSDANNDLAVISVNKDDARKSGVESVTLATFGNSDSMQVGDVVLAIGNALGEGNIATNGIVSGKDKSITVQNTTLTVLQTNAAINPGNSGGPLVNLKGEVIGINTAKISQTSTEGMGYSIPSNIAKPIIQGFMDSINKPYMGVQIATLTADMATQYNLPSAGAIVESVVEDSPAEKAGIQRLDIITGFNNEPILTSNQLTDAVRNCAIGDTVEVKLIRNGKENLTIKVTLEQRQ